MKKYLKKILSKSTIEQAKIVRSSLRGETLLSEKSKPKNNKKGNAKIAKPSQEDTKRKALTKVRPNFIECGERANVEKFIAVFLKTLPEHLKPFEGGSDRSHRLRLNFMTDEIEDVLAHIERTLKDWPGETHFRTKERRLFGKDRLVKNYKKRAFNWVDVRLEESSASVKDREFVYFSVIEFEFWSHPEVTYKVSPPLTSPRANDLLHPMRQATYDKIIEKQTPEKHIHLNEIAPGHNLAEHPFEIDVVYTWVDDTDEAWLESKNQILAKQNKTPAPKKESRALKDERFKNRDELRYSLRSLELYAPFVRHIYIVTAGQKPSWLLEEHPRVTLVDHKDIYAHKSCLPVFNSSSIETQLHHIKGLSEHFLYLNDDFFFGKMCSKDDFFYSNGIAKAPFSDSRVSAADIDDTCEEYIIADKNALELFEREYGFKAAPLLIHSPYPARVSVLKELEETFHAEFKKCEEQPFRSKHDLRPIAFMFPHYAYQKGLAVPYNISNRYLALWKPTIKDQLQNVLKRRSYKTFCINDVGVEDSMKEKTDNLVADFLENYFPMKSSFEK